MSILFYYSLLLSGALLLMWGACRMVRGRALVLGRGVLLSATVLAVVASALPILLARPVEIVVSADVARPFAVVMDTETVTDIAMPTASFSWWELLSKLYIIGVVVSMLLLLVTILRLARIIARSEAHGHLRLHDDSGLVPFAWGKWVIMSRSDFEAQGPILLAHEDAHLRGMHWLDLLMLSLLQSITWYCPAIRLLRGELLTAHEYIADRAVLNRGFAAPAYQILLISKASGRRFANSVTACINHVSLKNRILMMQNQTNSGRVAKHALALIPAGLLMVSLALIPSLSTRASELLPAKIVTENDVAATMESNSTIIAETPAVEDAEVTTMEINAWTHTLAPVVEEADAIPAEIDTPAIAETSVASEDKDDKVYQASEVLPQYPGGDAAMMKFLQENLRYPAAAMANKKQGNVVLAFVVRKDGSIDDIKVMRSVSPELDAEAVRVVKTFPKFTPGTNGGKPVAVSYVLPVRFKLTADKTATEKAGAAPENSSTGFATSVASKDDEKVFDAVEFPPQYPGGEAAMMKFVSTNLQYPTEAVAKGIQGRVVLMFVVKKDGSVGDVKVVRGADKNLDAEAIRIVKSFPKFTPGTQDGKPVNVNYVIPITFKLSSPTPEPEKK